jgi:hypothetical protein
MRPRDCTEIKYTLMDKHVNCKYYKLDITVRKTGSELYFSVITCNQCESVVLRFMYFNFSEISLFSDNQWF